MARHHKRNKAEGEINLVSMIDMLTVLVFFLLVYSSHEIEILPSAKDVQLPQSMAEQNARDAVVVIISETEILMNGQSLAPDFGYPGQPGARHSGAEVRARESDRARADRHAGADRRRTDREPRSHDHGRQRDSVSAAEAGHGDLDGGRLWSIVVGRPAEGVRGTARDGGEKLRAQHVERGGRTVSNLRAAVVHGVRGRRALQEARARLARGGGRAGIAVLGAARAADRSGERRGSAEAPRAPDSRARNAAAATAAARRPRGAARPSPNLSSRSASSSASPSPSSSPRPCRSRPSTARNRRAIALAWPDSCR